MAARIVSEVSMEVPAKVGLLAEVAQAFAGAGVNIEGMVAYEMEGMGSLSCVTSDNATATEIARGFGAEVSEADVVAVDLANQPGTLADTAGKIAAAGINVEYAYGSADATSATIYFKTADAAATVAALSG